MKTKIIKLEEMPSMFDLLDFKQQGYELSRDNQGNLILTLNNHE